MLTPEKAAQGMILRYRTKRIAIVMASYHLADNIGDRSNLTAAAYWRAVIAFLEDKPCSTS